MTIVLVFLLLSTVVLFAESFSFTVLHEIDKKIVSGISKKNIFLIFILLARFVWLIIFVCQKQQMIINAKFAFFQQRIYQVRQGSELLHSRRRIIFMQK